MTVLSSKTGDVIFSARQVWSRSHFRTSRIETPAFAATSVWVSGFNAFQYQMVAEGFDIDWNQLPATNLSLHQI